MRVYAHQRQTSVKPSICMNKKDGPYWNSEKNFIVPRVQFIVGLISLQKI